MLQSRFSFLAFDPMSWNEWQFQYLSDIRVNHELRSVKNPKTGILLTDEDTQVFLPHYEKKGNWRYGKPKKLKLGKRLIVVRSPAVRYKGKYLLLDSVHRVTQLEPKMLILDWVEIKESQRKLVTDLITDFWDE
jgi:hypothetical protein